MSDTTTTSSVESKLKNLIGETNPSEDNTAREKLVTARVRLLLNHSFFGNLATRLKLVNADEWLATLATDGRSLYYNSRFINLLDNIEQVQFGVAHEVLHCVYAHMSRRMHRDPQLYNIATDYCVNGDLIDHKIGNKITVIDILYDRQYSDMSSEQIYDILYDNYKDNQNQLQSMLDGVLDHHFGGGDDGDSGGSSDNSRSSGDKGKMPVLTPEQQKKVSDEFREAVINAASTEPNAGNIPGRVRKMIKDLTNPKMDWQDILQATITSAFNDDHSWLRPSRRGWHLDAILPGRTPGKEINIVAAIDTSGSISQKMLVEFLSEIQGAMESFTSYRVHVLSFDTEVHNPVEYTTDTIADMSEYDLGGFGGTDYQPVFNWIADNEIDADRLIMFTDGYPFGSWGDSELIDTLWIIHGSDNIEAPHGTTVHYPKH